jgi:hypothetical protein
MAVQLTIQTMVLLVVALILLVIGIMAVASASGLTVPIFGQITDLISKLTIPGAKP